MLAEVWHRVGPARAEEVGVIIMIIISIGTAIILRSFTLGEVTDGF